ncbi:MAG: V4R domain-containing protein [Gemmataceae bacterium]
MTPTSPADPAEALRQNLRTAVADDVKRDHVRVVNGVQPYRHHYFTPREFFQHNPHSGTITNAYGQRVIRATEELVPSLIAALDAEVGDAASEILYKCGLAWGRAEVEAFVPRVESEYEVEFDKLSMGTMLETWWWPFRVAGWGRWRYEFRHTARIVVIDLHDSFVAAAVGQSGRVACHFYAGLFAAVFSRLAKKPLASVELQCAAAGASHCRFMVATEQRVHEATIWRNEGITADEILQRLTHPN